MKNGVIVEEGFVYKDETHLTVSKTSLFFAGDGYTAYDCKGELVFRVDSYGPDTRDTGELVLMDASGRCLLTLRRKVSFLSSGSNQRVKIHNNLLLIYYETDVGKLI